MKSVIGRLSIYVFLTSKVMIAYHLSHGSNFICMHSCKVDVVAKFLSKESGFINRQCLFKKKL